MSDLPYGARYAGPSRSPAPPGGVGGAPAPTHAMRRNMSEGANLAGREHGAGAPGVGGGPSSPFFAAASGGSAAERAAGVSNTNYAAEAADAPLLHRTLSSDDLTPSVFVGAAPTVFLPKSKTSNNGSDLRDDIVDQGGDEEEDSRRRGAWQGGFGSPTKGGAYDAEDDFDFGQPDRFGQKFRMHGPQPCRDSFWAILFLLHLGFIFVLLIWGFVLQPESAACNPDDENPDHPCDPIEEAEKIEAAGGLTLKGTSGHHVLAIAASCCLVGIFLSFGYLMLVRKFARALIWVTLSLNILIWIGYSVFLLIFGQLIAAGIFLFISMIWIVFAFCWRRRIPFAAAMLTAVSATLESYPAPIYFAWGSLPVFVTWFIVWVSSFIAGERLQWVNGYFFWLFLLISLYWVAQVVKNVVHVTAAGTFASWYFFARPDAGASYTGRVPGMPANPTQAAFRRCITMVLKHEPTHF